MLPVLKGVLIVGGLSWALLVVALALLQDMLIFPRPGGEAAQLDDAARQLGMESVRFPAADGTELYGWFRDGGGDRVILICHGNGATVSGYAGLQRLLADNGWDSLVFAYRGYPGSDGSPSEAGTREDALGAWNLLTETRGYDPANIVLHGQSLGGGVCAQLAEVQNPAGLVLESTFTSVLSIASARFPIMPVSLLLRHPFETDQRAVRIAMPVFVVHSREDTVIGVEHGRTLSKLFADAEYHEVGGNRHGEIIPTTDDAVGDAYLRFLERTQQ